MNNWKIIPSIVLATVLIFGAGVFTGGLLVNHVKPSAAKKSSAVVPAIIPVTNCPPNLLSNVAVKISASLPEILTKPFLMKLDEQLHLTAEQHKAVEKIINEGQDDIKKVVRSSRLEIREVLAPEQLKQFDILVKRPSYKKNSGTNGATEGTGAQTSFQERLQEIVDRSKTNRVSATPRFGQTTISNLSPEAQIILLEKQRIEAAGQGANLLPPPPAVTNPPPELPSGKTP